MSVFTENWIWTTISLLITLVVIFIIYVKLCYSYWHRRGVETPKIKFPFGNAKKQFFRQASFGEIITSTYNKFKSQGLKYCGYYIAVTPTWIVLDLELIKAIMTKDFVHFMDHVNYINEKNDPLTGQLFMLKGSKWKNMRVKLTPTFTSGKMKMMFPTLLECSKELMVLMNKAADQQFAMEIKDVVARFTTDVIGSCAFGLDCNSLKDPNSTFRIYGKKIFERGPNKIKSILKSMCMTSFPWILDVMKEPLFQRQVIDFFVQLVKETISYREKNGVTRKDFMHLLIQLKNNVNISDEDSVGKLDGESKQQLAETLSIEQIAAQAFVFFVAGFETSSTTLTFCFYELALNQELQNCARKEVTAVYEKYNGILTYEALTDMTYTEMCISETLRKYPPLPVLSRECTKTYKVPDSDLVIEKGTKVFIPIWAIQKDPEYYSEPEKFDPERFSQENKSQRHSFSWLPFGEGPRACIGLRFGMMQMKVAIAVLLKHYKFSLNEKTSVPLVLDPKSTILNSKDGIWLNIERM